MPKLPQWMNIQKLETKSKINEQNPDDYFDSVCSLNDGVLTTPNGTLMIGIDGLFEMQQLSDQILNQLILLRGVSVKSLEMVERIAVSADIVYKLSSPSLSFMEQSQFLETPYGGKKSGVYTHDAFLLYGGKKSGVYIHDAFLLSGMSPTPDIYDADFTDEAVLKLLKMYSSNYASGTCKDVFNPDFVALILDLDEYEGLDCELLGAVSSSIVKFHRTLTNIREMYSTLMETMIIDVKYPDKTKFAFNHPARISGKTLESGLISPLADSLIQQIKTQDSIPEDCDWIEVASRIYIKEYSQAVDVNYTPEKKINDATTSPKKIVEHLDINVIGQTQAKKALANSFFTHQAKMANTSDQCLPSGNLMLVGPSGSGKTHLIKELSEIVDTPYVIIDAQSLTGTGWSGDNVSDIMESLLLKADGDIKKAEKGIVVLDEIDKLATNGYSKTNHNTKEVQSNLLKLIEGTDIKLDKKGIISTNNMLFIFAGAFVGLDEIVNERVRPTVVEAKMGFNAPMFQKENPIALGGLINANAEDLIEYGLMPEFVGRIKNVAKLSPLDHEELLRIFTTPKSIINQYKNLFEVNSTKLIFEETALKELVVGCDEMQTGVRGMEARVADLLQTHLSEIDPNRFDTVVITKDSFIGQSF